MMRMMMMRMVVMVVVMVREVQSRLQVINKGRDASDDPVDRQTDTA